MVTPAVAGCTCLSRGYPRVPMDPQIAGRNAAARVEFRDLPMAGPNAPVARNDMNTRSNRAVAVPMPDSVGMLSPLQAARNELVPQPRARPADLRGGALAPAASKRSITVSRGDTLSEIAAANGTTVKALMSANSIKDPRKLRAGAMLTIPAAQPVRRKKKRQ
jgi:nucleoid-associated protein YgaU